MGYPVRYRNNSPQTSIPSRPRGGSGPRGQVVAFPNPRPGSGRFGPPRTLPGRASFGQRPAYIPPRSPLGGGVLRPGAFGAASGLAAGLLWWALNEDFGWAGPAAPVNPAALGWMRVCGPAPYPGPPYLHQRHWNWFAPVVSTPRCELGGQAVDNVDGSPVAGDSTLFYYWGPNDSNRYYVSEQWIQPSGFPDHPGLRSPLNSGLAVLGPGAWSIARPTDWVPDPIPSPMPAAPFFPPLPPSGPPPQGPVRGYTAEAGIRIGRVESVADAQGNTLAVVDLNNPPDRRPPPRERERKIELGSRIGRAAITGFRALQTWGQINGAVDALWRAIPARYRPKGRRTWWQKYMDVYENFEHIDLAKAAANAAAFAASIRAWGFVYDNATRALTTMGGPNVGRAIARQMFNMERPVRMGLSQKERRRKHRRRLRRFSGRHSRAQRYYNWKLTYWSRRRWPNG